MNMEHWSTGEVEVLGENPVPMLP